MTRLSAVRSCGPSPSWCQSTSKPPSSRARHLQYLDSPPRSSCALVTFCTFSESGEFIPGALFFGLEPGVYPHILFFRLLSQGIITPLSILLHHHLPPTETLSAFPLGLQTRRRRRIGGGGKRNPERFEQWTALAHGGSSRRRVNCSQGCHSCLARLTGLTISQTVPRHL